MVDSCKLITDAIWIQCVSDVAAAPALQLLYTQAWHGYGYGYHLQVITCNMRQRLYHRCIDRLMVGPTATGQILSGVWFKHAGIRSELDASGPCSLTWWHGFEAHGVMGGGGSCAASALAATTKLLKFWRCCSLCCSSSCITNVLPALSA